jgi:NADH-quinone oxidoreductase E subunit
VSSDHNPLKILGPYATEAVTPLSDAALGAEIAAVAATYPTKQAALLPAQHLVPGKYGWISPEAQAFVAGVLGLTPAHVLGAVTFYTLFRTKPVGKYHIQVCRTLSCAIGGNEQVIAHLQKKLGIRPGEVTPDGRFSLVLVECLGACGYAPMFQVNDDYHERLTIEKIDSLLDSMR